MTIYGSPWDKYLFSQKQKEYDMELFDEQRELTNLRYRENEAKLRELGINLSEIERFINSENKPELRISDHLKKNVSKHLKEIKWYLDTNRQGLFVYEDVEEFILMWRIMTELLSIPRNRLDYKLNCWNTSETIAFSISLYPDA